MNTIFTKVVFSLCLLGMGVLSSFAAEVIPYAEALEKAKAEKKMIVVVSDGSDWLLVSPELNKKYNSFVEKKGDKFTNVIWAIHDVKNKKPETEEEKKAPSPPVRVWNFPGIQILDDEARPLFFREKLDPSELDLIDKMVKTAEKTKTTRDNYWVKAEAAEKAERAENLAKGLLALPEHVRKQKVYNKVRERAAKEDPEDKKGYVFALTYEPLRFVEKEVNVRVKEKQYKEAYDVINSKLKLPALSKHQKQYLMAAKFRVARSEGNLADGLKYLKQVVDIDPATDVAKGAEGMARFYTQPVKLSSMKWTNLDNRPDWLPMMVDVSSAIKGSGKYKVEFKRQQGNTKFRNPAFKTTSGRVISAITDNKEGHEFLLDLPSGSKVILEVESRGGDHWYSGRGDIIVTKQ